MKTAFSFFLQIYSLCGAPAFLAIQHTTVCLDCTCKYVRVEYIIKGALLKLPKLMPLQQFLDFTIYSLRILKCHSLLTFLHRFCMIL